MSAVEAWEGAAISLLRQLGIDAHEDPESIAEQCGLRIVETNSRGARACLADGIIRLRPRMSRVLRNGTIVHEIGHIALDLSGVEQSEHGAAFVGASVLIPRRHLQRSLMRYRNDFEALRNCYPHASAEMLARRLVEVTEGLVVTIVQGRRTKVRVCSSDVGEKAPPWEPREREVLALARELDEAVNASGVRVIAYPVRDVDVPEQFVLVTEWPAFDDLPAL